MPDVTALPRPGDVFAGKYLIERVIGSGKNSLVFAAQHCVTGKRFAIEWLLERSAHARHEALIDDDADTPVAAMSGEAARLSSDQGRDAEDLVSEAHDLESSPQVVGHFRHPNVLEVYDVGEAAGSLYTVMEWSDGESLEARLARTGPMSLADASELLVPCMRGMHEAHCAGILHRDLKPANIFLCQASRSGPPVAKVLDFELAAASSQPSDASALVTLRGATDSKPYYRAPEQIRGRDVDQRADVYAFGAILYEVLTGRPPFAPVRYKRDEPPQTAGLHGRTDKLPPGADRLVGRAMARDVSRRFQTLAELADAVEALVRSPVAFSTRTLPGQPPFDHEPMRPSSNPAPQPIMFEGLDADSGSDPGHFTHEVSFTRSRPWPRPTPDAMFDPPESDEPERPASDWSEPPSTSVPIDWNEAPHGSIPEWSEPPRAPASEWSEQPQDREWRRQQPSHAAPHTPFYIETPFKAPSAHYPVRRPWWHGKGIHIAAAFAIIAVTALIVTREWSSSDDVVASFDVVAKPGLTVVELDESAEPAPAAHVVSPASQPTAAVANPAPVEPAPAPVVAVPFEDVKLPAEPAQVAIAAEPGSPTPKSDSAEPGSAQWYRLPLAAADREHQARAPREGRVERATRAERPARSERRARSAPAETPKPAPRAVSRPKSKVAPRTSPWDAPVPAPASSGDPMPMHLM
jgi:serine/threonine protein kinase